MRSLLDAQQVDDVGVLEVGEVVLDRDAHLLDAARHERGRRDQRDVHAEHPEAHDVAAGDAAVQDVADDEDLEAVELAAQVLAHAEEVEQALRGMLVLAVAGVDDARLGVGRERLAGPGGGMPHDDDVGRVGAQRDRRVLERLALLDGRAAGLEGQGVGRESLGGEVEARRRARRRLPEEVDDRAPAQRGHLLDVALEHRQEALGGVEQQLDVGAREVLDADQVPLGHGHASFARTRTTSSTPSHSATRTLMRSRGAVGRFLPT